MISFDGDDTLWDFASAKRTALGSVLQVMIELGAPPGIIDVDRMVAIRLEVGGELGEANTPLLELRRESLRRAAIEAQLNIDAESIDLLFHRFVSERDNANRAFNDVGEVLRQLRSDGWTIALLTNGNADAWATGLGGFFDALFYAEKIGVRKPDIGAFRAVTDAVGSRPQDLVHVGDSLEHDVAGANASGATSIWLNRTGQAAVADITPDFEIASMSHLPEVLDALS